MKQNKIYIYGKHALIEALAHAPRAIDRVFLAKENNDAMLREAIKKAGVTVSPLGSDKAPKSIKSSEPHQGIIGRLSLDDLVQPYEEYIRDLKTSSDIALVLLGEIEDPHNVGAIIRSAAAFGVSGVLIPERNQAPITGAVIKVSAGMAFRVPLVKIGNINNVIRNLKDRGFWVYGLNKEARQTVSGERFDKPSVFILGNESKGIRQKTSELCDTLLSIPISPRCESLNVAASAAVTLFVWSSRHKNETLYLNKKK
jgi:23S rRNA (guanosine2251-2'-O)-methyltransferase